MQTRVQSGFQQSWSAENENIPLQQRSSISNFNSLQESHRSTQPQTSNPEMVFSINSESEAGSPLSGFSEIMLNTSDQFELAVEEQDISQSPATIVTQSSTASSVSEKQKVSFMRKTLMRAAKRHRVQTVE